MFLEFRDVNGRLTHLPVESGGEPITIGRNPGSSIYSKQSTVSRNHGRIGFEGQTLYFKDLGSSNGSFINGESTTRTSLQVGDLVRCGGPPTLPHLNGCRRAAQRASRRRHAPLRRLAQRPPPQTSAPTGHGAALTATPRPLRQ